MASLFQSRGSPTKPSLPSHPPASGPSTPRRGGNHPRQSSGVYNTLNPQQIKTFKECFNLVDQDSDGFVSSEDLRVMLQNLGMRSEPKDVARYMDGMGGRDNRGRQGVNFTQFLTMFGELLSGMDDAATLSEAFACFDEKDQGVVDASELRQWLGGVGDKMSDAEIDRLLSGPFTDRSGRRFDYKAFVEAVRMSEATEAEE
ncbi:unnamed protein product [Jaminaea pallidilutea]